MSYILEALRKSQQERDLGRVPTLDATAMFDEDKPEPRRSLWPMAAVGLAGLAMIVALYAAMRAPQPGTLVLPDPIPAGIQGPGSDAVGSARAQIATLADPGGNDLDGTPARHRPLIPPAAQGSAAAATDRAGVPRLGPTQPPTPVDDARAAPLVEPPPPKSLARSGSSPALLDPGALDPIPIDPIPLPPEPDPRVRFDGTGPIYHPDLSEESDLAAELALQRQLDAEADQSALDGYYYADDPPTPIPPDLIAEIEAFKREVTGQAGGGAPVKTSAKQPATDPKALRLTPAQEAALPPYVMTVHVYDPEPSQRFVLINGLKYREGAKTREGLQVEQVLADGAVLSYLGNAFYVPR